MTAPVRAPVSVPEPPPPPPIVQRSELVKGYEYSKGQYVTISKEDLEKITPETAREMQILEFVKLAEVDPIYFETSYYVTPERAGERAYALLFEALRRSGYVALAQFAMHNREHIVVIRPGRTGIVLHTMFYETEIRRDDEYRTDTSNVAERELELALLLVQNLAAPFEPARYHDTYKEKLDALIAAKIEGKEPIEEPKPQPSRPVTFWPRWSEVSPSPASRRLRKVTGRQAQASEVNCRIGASYTQGRLCPRTGSSKRPRGTKPLPLVRVGGPERPAHVLLRFLRSRVALTDGSRLSARADFRPGQGSLRLVRNGYSRSIPRPEAQPRTRPRADASAVGTEDHQSPHVVGRRSYCAGRGGRRSMRLVEYPDALPSLPS